jgi:lipopolysaccharide biosynthesis glycosyltransferase
MDTNILHLSTNDGRLVVTCASGSYIPFACYTFQSALLASNDPTLRYLLLAVDAPDTVIADARQFFKKWPQVEVRYHQQVFTEKHYHGRFGPAAITRLELDEILGPNYDRVLYIDGDMHVNGDLASLFTVDMEGHSVAACEAISIRGDAAYTSKNAAFGLPSQLVHLNAGLLLFDWPAVLKKGVLARAREVLLKTFDLPMNDQNAMNMAVDGKYFRLDRRWNVSPYFLAALPDAFIAHFVGKSKPWHRNCPHHLMPYRRKMQAAFKNTVWQNCVEPLGVKDLFLYVDRSIRHRLKMRKGNRAARNTYGILPKS